MSNVFASKAYPTKPLQPGNTVDVTIESTHEPDVVQYEFYIPAAIWDLPAVRKFISQLASFDPNATIFKGTTGVWQGDEEDTHIYRLIRKPSPEISDAKTQQYLCGLIGEMMAQLSEWTESDQEAFLFTETKMSSTLSKKK